MLVENVVNQKILLIQKRNIALMKIREIDEIFTDVPSEKLERRGREGERERKGRLFCHIGSTPMVQNPRCQLLRKLTQSKHKE